MVKTRRLHQTGPTDGQGGRKIGGGPVYDLGDVKNLAKKTGAAGILLVTKDCITDAATLGMDMEDVAYAISLLTPAHYHDSEWCHTGKTSKYFPCDSYTLLYEHYDSSCKRQIKLYMKFFVKEGNENILFVSLHD